MNIDHSGYVNGINSLTVFRKLRDDEVIGGLCRLFEKFGRAEHEEGSSELVSIYSEILASMYPVTSDLSEYILHAVLKDDNFYVEAVASGRTAGDEIRTSVEQELTCLQSLSELDCSEIKKCIGVDHPLPSWSNHTVDIKKEFTDKLDNLGTTGYGIFSEHIFFRLDNKEIVPVPHPDAQALSELFGYERQRDMIVKNTLALIQRNHASNMLLYGDAGTGKSSTIKAVAREYAHKGLRLVEIKKDQLYQLADVLDRISRQSLSFILFIDDLSFTENDDNFSALKATLEGSISGFGDNVAIYATSNRRHLIRERFSDRQGDELHINDTLQETMSLAARFGLVVSFEKPDKDEYLDIVCRLADTHKLEISRDELITRAEAFAIRRNGRSPRTARQLIELLKAGIG